MQKSDNTRQAVSAHRKIRSSTTLNRRYVKRPALSGDMTKKIRRSPRLTHFASSPAKTTLQSQSQVQSQSQSEQMPVVSHPIQKTVNHKLQLQRKVAISQGQPTPSAKEIKEEAIKRAIASASGVESKKHKKKESKTGLHFGVGRVVLALSCAAIVAFAIVYFVNLNMPDLSLRVAAMQTGIDASYPGFIPRDYSVSSISSEDGKITIDFHNNTNNNDFTIIEEVSSWDSNALLSNYVKEEFGDSFATIREQGLTIYINGSSAAWVNGGILYKINAANDVLTNKQIRSIAVSL